MPTLTPRKPANGDSNPLHLANGKPSRGSVEHLELARLCLDAARRLQSRAADHARERPIAAFAQLVVGAMLLVWASRAVTGYLSPSSHAHHTFVLVGSVSPWFGPPRQDSTVAWSDDRLLPDRTFSLRPRSRTRISPSHSSRLAVHSVDLQPHPLSLPANAPRPSDILFGWTTNTERAVMHASLWRHWLVFGSPCVIILPPRDRKHLLVTQQEMARQRIGCRIVVSGVQKYRDRVLSATGVMHEIANEVGAKWIVMSDDDTIWLDLRMIQRLLADYSPQQDVMIGSVSEAQRHVDMFGDILFGGGGILLSSSFAGRLGRSQHECIRTTNATRYPGGDGLLSSCAAIVKGVSVKQAVTHHPALHQMDLRHDPSGLFQSGRQIVSFHHAVHGWYHLFARHSAHHVQETDITAVTLLQQAARILGGDNLFKRFVFADGYAFVCLGYSVTLHNEPLTPFDLPRMEVTWPEPHPPRRDLVTRRGIPEGRPHWSSDPDFKTTYYLRSIHPLNAEQFEMLHSNMRGETIRLIYQAPPAKSSSS